MSMSEKVLCISRAHLENHLPPFQGIFSNISLITTLFTDVYDLPRSKIEDDPSIKQLITYSLVQYGQGEDVLYFSYSRSGTEKRLESNLSLGVGGHIGPQTNIELRSRLYTSQYIPHFRVEAQREIDEEIVYNRKAGGQDRFGLSLFGLINDDSNPVGRVHLGLLYAFHIGDPNARSRESALRDGSMISPRQILENYDRYESWSKIVIDRFIK